MSKAGQFRNDIDFVLCVECFGPVASKEAIEGGPIGRSAGCTCLAQSLSNPLNKETFVYAREPSSTANAGIN